MQGIDISSNHTLSSNSTRSDTEKCELYTGKVCREELHSLRFCYLGMNEGDSDADNIFVETTSRMEDAEQALLYVSLFATPQCSAEVKPFLCPYLFGLCDKTTGVSYRPSVSQCRKIRDHVCVEEWRTAIEFGLSLPDCDVEFSEESYVLCVHNGSRSGIIHHQFRKCYINFGLAGSGIPVLPVADGGLANCSEITCCKDFFCDSGSGTCVPKCGSWSQYSYSQNIAFNILVLTSTCFGIIGGIGVLIIAGLRRKRV